MQTPFYLPAVLTESVTLYAKWQSDSSLLEFELATSGNSYIVKGLGTETAVDVVIPSSYNDKPVTEIAENAFANKGNIKSIIVPSSVTKIGKNAFGNCVALESITLPFIGESATATGANALLGYVFSQTENCGAKTTSYYGDNPSDYAVNYIPATLKSVTVTNATKIAQGAFYNCANVKYLVLNEGITVIGKNAFAYATSLYSVNIPSSVTELCEGAFRSALVLNQLSVGDASVLTTLGKEVFAYCVALTELSLPDIETIPQGAFANCYKLKTLTLGGIEAIGEKAFANCYALTSVDISSVVTLAEKAFSYCTSMTKITLPSTITTLGNYVFEYSGITEVLIDDSFALTAIPNGTFSNCTKLSQVVTNAKVVEAEAAEESVSGLIVLNSQIVTIGESAFENCTKLTTANLDVCTALTTLGNKAFSGCTTLATVTLPSTVITLGDEALYGCSVLSKFNSTENYTAVIPNSVTSVGTGLFQGCANLNSVTLCNSLTEIPDNSFYGCTSLSEVLLGSAVITSIGENAFYGCIDLAEYEVVDTVTEIGDNAFYGCTNLRIFEIEEGSVLASIGEKAFYGCTELVQLKIIPTTVTTVGEQAFEGCSSLRLFLAANSSAASLENWYEGWENYAEDEAIMVFYAMSSSKILTTNDTTYILCTDTSGNDYALLLDYTGADTTFTVPASVTFTSAVPVKVIAASAFNGKTAIRVMILGENVTEVQTMAFYNCTNLESMYISRSVETVGVSALDGCTKLTKLYLGATETAANEDFGGNWYAGWNTISSVDRIVYYSVALTATSGYDYTLYQDTSANTEYLIDASNNAHLVNYTGSEVTVTVPEQITVNSANYDVTSINGYTFNSSAIKHLNIGGKVTTIDSLAFNGLTGVASMYIPASVTALEDGALDKCTLLYVLLVGADDESVPADWDADWNTGKTVYYNMTKDTFANVSNVIYVKTGDTTATAAKAVSGTSATISATVTIGSAECAVDTIGSHAFYGSAAISVTIESGITTIQSKAFYNADALTSITLPNSVTSLGENAFEGCVALTSAVLSSGLTQVSANCFLDCTALTKVIIREGVTTIGANAFYSATALASIVLPESLTTVEAGAFGDNDALVSIYYKGDAAEYAAITVAESNDALSSEEVKVYYYIALAENLPAEDGYNDIYWRFTNDAETEFAYWTESDKPTE